MHCLNIFKLNYPSVKKLTGLGSDLLSLLYLLVQVQRPCYETATSVEVAQQLVYKRLWNFIVRPLKFNRHLYPKEIISLYLPMYLVR